MLNLFSAAAILLSSISKSKDTLRISKAVYNAKITRGVRLTMRDNLLPFFIIAIK